MEIAVAASSPLGQYLAELDAEAGGGASAAQLLAAPRAVARKRPRRRQVARGWSWRQLIQQMRRRVELVAVRRLIPELCGFHPTIREELQQATGSDSKVLAGQFKTHGYGWERAVVLVELLSGAEEIRGLVGGAGGALVVFVAVMIAVGRRSEDVFGLETMGWVVAVAVFFLLGLELSVRLLLAWYARRSRQLVGSLSAFEEALKKFNKVYTDSLTLVKRAELASRGYRLGAGLLPPIGRLEAGNADTGDDGGGRETAAIFAAKTQLRCLPLRRKLRQVNDQLQSRTSELLQEDQKVTDQTAQDPVEEESTQDERTPSLLLTALAKQRNRGVLLLENALHSVLVRDMARTCSSRGGAEADCSLFRILRSQRFAVIEVVGTLCAWSGDLEAWNTTRNPVALLAIASDIKSSEQRQRKQQLGPANYDDPRVKGMAIQLQELRSASETLTALVIATQHELLPAESVAERLSSSRDAMLSIVQQLEVAWGKYDNTLSALTGADDKLQDIIGGKLEEGGDCRSKPTAALTSSSVPVPEDPNYTVVFTGTSIGDEGFDLQALLKQQDAETAAASSTPTPHFVRELRDVLAHRQALAQPGLTKQVDHDPPESVSPAPDPRSETPPAPPAADTMFALPRAPPRGRPRRPPTVSSDSLGDNALSGAVATAFNLELQSLLHRVQSSSHQDVVENLGNNEGGEAQPDELLATSSAGH